MTTRIALLSALMLLLAGCTIQPAPPDTPAVERERVHAFELEGRIAASDGERAANGQLRWTHRPERDEWVVLSPLGQIVAQVIGTPDGALLRTSDGQQLSAPDTATLLPHALGVNAPASHLPLWIQAIPAEGARVLETDAFGRPARISDNGWIIEYPDYSADTPQATPRRVFAQWGQARLRIVIDRWTPHD